MGHLVCLLRRRPSQTRVDKMSEGVKGTKEMLKAAEAGMALFGKAAEVEYDTEAAIAYKEKIDATIKGLEEEAAALTGKDNKKARTEKSKEASALKADKMYVDACKVVKGLEPPNGNFVKSVKEGEAPKTTAKEEPVVEEVKKEVKKD